MNDDLPDAPFATAAATPELPSAPFSQPDMSGVRRQFEPFALRPRGQIGVLAAKAAAEGPKSDQSFTNALEAGLQMSVSGLIARGKEPDVYLQPNPNFAARVGANIGAFAGDLPFMVAGGALGAGGGPVTAGAGAFGLPAGLRATLMDAYTKGDFKSFGDFWNRASGIIWETIKGEITGAATAGAGIASKTAIPAAAPTVARVAVPTAAEIATMTTVGHALEGEIPSAQDFVDAAVILGGLKASGAIAGKLRTIYAKTGVPPMQVAADSARDPSIAEDLGVRQVARPVETGTGLKLSDTGIPFPEGTGSEVSQPLGVPSKEALAKMSGADKIEGPGFGGVGTGTREDIPRAYQPLAEAETARAIVPGIKAQEVAASPFADAQAIKGEPKPTHVNYNYLNSTDDAKLALARLSQVYEEEIQTQRRGTVSWEQTSQEAAKALSDTLGGKDLSLIMPREPGTPAGAAELLARKQLVVGAAEAMMASRDDILAKGINATPEDKLQFLAAIERASIVQSEFLGARAEVGRALNILKSTAADAERMQQINEVIRLYGGKDPVQLAAMLKQVDTAAGALKFADLVTKASTWEKVIEAWKAGLVSGPVTHMANMIGNGAFAAIRVPIDAVAVAIGRLRGAQAGERVELAEPIARLTGLLQGVSDGAKVAMATFKTAEDTGKAEHFRPAMEGKAGEIVRLPFRLLSAEDALFKTMNERGEAYSLAVREAAKEGLNPATQEFRERVVQIASNPTEAMQKEIDAAATRFTFNTPLGEKGQALQNFVRKTHLEWAVPFIRTPGNILKEMTRMTPLAPLVEEWRADIAKGGAARDKALAEVAVGTGISVAVVMHAMNGNISGAGDPDPGKRRAKLAAGWQPYSIKIGDTWYSYQRIQPIGTLIGMAADMAEVWDHMTDEESDKVPKMLAVAFANAVTNQTALQGLTSVVQVMADPTRYGPKFVQQYAASVIPNVVGQTTAMFDPVVREVDGIVDAVKARIPGLRQGLLPKRDIFGEPLQTKERLGAVSPVTETTESDDKVRSEAARLGVSVADTPKKTHLGRLSGKLGDVKLEPEERDKFADIGGHLAYKLLQTIVNGPQWDALPDLAKKRVFERVFSQAHRVAAMQAMPLEKRVALTMEISEKVMQALQPEEAEAPQ